MFDPEAEVKQFEPRSLNLNCGSNFVVLYKNINQINKVSTHLYRNTYE